MPQKIKMDDQVDILIVDDQPENLATLESMLEKEPLSIRKAGSGKEALELMREIDFAFVLLDVGMPDMDGYETAKRMRSNEKTGDVPIVFITAIGEEELDMSRDFSPGPVDYLFRPIEPAILKSKVRIFSDLHRQGKAIQDQLRLMEERNKELEQFAYVASHDLREPLRVVTLYLELLERHCHGRLDEKAGTFIHYAVDGAKRMDMLIKGLLQYSRVTTSDEPFTSVNMNEVFEEATSNLSGVIRESGAVFIKNNLPTLSGVHSLLVQLLQNLLSNAVKFGKPGAAPEVRIFAARRHGDGVFSVKDKGIGIEPKHFERIFVIFQRLHTMEQYPGIGLGLALSKRIVERHHGRIWLESALEEGSTFFFSLPAEADQGSGGRSVGSAKK
ncbi:MAG: response regulator [Deltaproteobacteria bacterium]